jgi:hypothetical protein
VANWPKGLGFIGGLIIQNHSVVHMFLVYSFLSFLATSTKR